MNLHPLTALLLVILAFLFFSQGQLFFFFATLAIGFLLIIVSLSNSTTAAQSHDEHCSSVYPEKMELIVKGEEFVPFSGKKEFAEGIGGAIDFSGRLIGKLFSPIIPSRKEEHKK
ncbi:MAG: hypothetical protein V1644_01410 [Candidatus Micrarchaeota archaeon]